MRPHPEQRRRDRTRRLSHLERELFGSAFRFRMYPMIVESGKRAMLWDVDGNEYIDFSAGAAVANTGYAHPSVVRAIDREARKLTHGVTLIFQNPPSIELAQRLVELAPGDFEKKVWLGNSGSAACEAVYDLLPAATKRRRMITFFGSHHGLTVGGNFLSGHRIASRYLASPSVVKVPYPYLYRSRARSGEECAKQCIELIEEAFTNVCPPEDTAGILVEPIESLAGDIVPPDAFLPQLRELCDRYGLLLVVDEVKSGFGRTGKMFAVEHSDVVPDLLILGKPVASGLPLGACVGRSEILDSESVSHGSSAAGHPVSCAAALATLNVIRTENLVQNAKVQGDYMLRRLSQMKDRHPLIGDVRGKGLMIGVELIRDKRIKTPAAKEALKVAYRAWEKGLIMITVGTHSNVLEITPPLIIKRDEIDRGLDILQEALRDVEQGNVSDSVASLESW